MTTQLADMSLHTDRIGSTVHNTMSCLRRLQCLPQGLLYITISLDP